MLMFCFIICYFLLCLTFLGCGVIAQNGASKRAVSSHIENGESNRCSMAYLEASLIFCFHHIISFDGVIGK